MDIWNTSIKPNGIEKVKIAINDKIANVFTGDEFMLLYTHVYDVLTSRSEQNSHLYYDNHTKEIIEYINYLKDESISFEEKYNRFKLFNKWLGKFLMYLNRYHTIKNNLDSLEEKGKKIFNTNLFSKEKIILINSVCNEIHKEREGQIINISNMINIFSEMDVLDSFETIYFEKLNEYYLQSPMDEFIKTDLIKYIKFIEQIRMKETLLIQKYLKSINLDKMNSIINTIFLFNKLSLMTDINIIFKKEVVDDIRLIYSVLKDIDIVFICNIFSEYLIWKIEYLNNINDLLNKFNFVNNLIKTVFNDDINIVKIFASHMKKVMSNHKLIEDIINYTDYVLSVSSKESEPETILKNNISLIKYLINRDSFIELYSNKLSKRLLQNKSQCYELEKYSLSLIKFEMGLVVTTKLQGMINDIMFSKQYKFEHDKLDVLVITQGLWPKQYKPNLILPPKMVEHTKAFEDYYKSITSGKRIEWMYWISTMVLDIFLNKKKYEIHLTVPQGLVLIFLIEKNGVCNISDLEFIGLEMKYLKGILHSLSCLKYKLVSKSTDSNKINNDDTFIINNNFVSNLKKIQLPIICIDENKIDNSKLNELRGVQIDSAIVRILKTRKIITHNELLPEIKKQVSHLFEPELSMIKNRISSLIEKEYIKRNIDNSSIYEYIA
jgi:cullin 1